MRKLTYIFLTAMIMLCSSHITLALCTCADMKQEMTSCCKPSACCKDGMANEGECEDTVITLDNISDTYFPSENSKLPDAKMIVVLLPFLSFSNPLLLDSEKVTLVFDSPPDLIKEDIPVLFRSLLI